jgi:hypothetical protein
LAAQAVRIVTGLSPQEASFTIIDGVADQGIDAIAVTEVPEKHIYLIQAKWHMNGRASSDRSAVLEILTGLRLIDDEDFTEFNPRGRQLAEDAKTVMSSGPVPVTLVFVLMRANEVTEGFNHALEVGEREFNQHGEALDHRIILASEIWSSIREDLASKPVDLNAELFPWFAISVPYESYQGVVSADNVAEWMHHGADLFRLNIRNPLGRTQINNALVNTLLDEPAHFWYFNNGITVLCESVEKDRQSVRTPERSPLGLTLRNASVVNGAQTVRSIAEAIAADETASGGQVGVRIIVTGRSQDFAKDITQATNRQNRVEARDFIALDPIQASIMEEMRAELGLEYSVRRSELDPPEETGCSVVEAACALACARQDVQYAARMGYTLEVLWERGSQGIYDVLFRPQPGVYLLWNAVQVLRTVRRTLHELRSRYEGRGAALTEHGVYLLTHLVFLLLDKEEIDEPDPDLSWRANAEAETPNLVAKLLPALMSAIDTRYTNRSQIRAVCADIDRCRELVGDVVELLANQGENRLPDPYRRTRSPRRRRRPNAVSVLVDQHLLEDETPVVLHFTRQKEIDALQDWLAEDERRARGTWVNHRSKPILWAADGQQYSPSGLISHIWEQAGWEERPAANQGTARWAINSGETLAQLAWRSLDSGEETD